jgi:hypothetical protein
VPSGLERSTEGVVLPGELDVVPLGHLGSLGKVG